jgi:hypothetical protein
MKIPSKLGGQKQTINDSMTLTIQCVASVFNMGRRLHVINHEARALRS